MMSFDTDGFNYRSGHPAQYESLWSAVHKFMALNAISSVSFLRHFQKQRAKDEFLPEWIRRQRCSYPSDLRVAGKINAVALAKACGAGKAWLGAATMDRYTTVFSHRQCTAPFLRFCPICIDRGFHAAPFQLLDWNKCPAHDELLRDSCPKCGDWIPVGLPKSNTVPYSCAKCGYPLWLDLGADEWPPAFEDDSVADRFSVHASARLRGASDLPIAEGPRMAVFWMRKTNEYAPAGDRIQQCADQIFKASSSTGGKCAVISREWGNGFQSRRWQRRMFESCYAAIPIQDEKMRADIFALYRVIERRIFRSFPVTLRRKSLQRTLKTVGFQRLPGIQLPPEFLGYLIWRAYWEERPSTLCMRRIFGKDFRGSHYQRKMERSVYWRYTQHAKILGPVENYTSADAWSHLHFFGLSAFATYRQAIKFVLNTERLENVIKIHHAGYVVQAKTPLTLLVRLPKKSKAFELRIYP